MTTPRIISWRVDNHGLIHAQITAPNIRRRYLTSRWVPTNLRVNVHQDRDGIWQTTSVAIVGHPRRGAQYSVTESWYRDRGALGGAWRLTDDGQPHPMPRWLLPLVDELVCEFADTKEHR